MLGFKILSKIKSTGSIRKYNPDLISGIDERYCSANKEECAWTRGAVAWTKTTKEKAI
jgi:hypothetical protein